MTVEAQSVQGSKKLHPPAVRVMHWLNALAVVIMIGSGWTIYNDNPVFGWLRFPAILTIGGDPAVSGKLNGDSGFGGALQWHFAAMWLLMINGALYLAYGVATGRFRRMLVPIRPGKVAADLKLALMFKLKHDDIRKYNSVQKLLYVGVIMALVVQVTAGLALWKPMQFWRLASLFHDVQGIRVAHFLGMVVIVLFLVVHVVLALIFPRTLAAMVTGGPEVDESDAEPDLSAATAQSGV